MKESYVNVSEIREFVNKRELKNLKIESMSNIFDDVYFLGIYLVDSDSKILIYSLVGKESLKDNEELFIKNAFKAIENIIEKLF